MREKAEFTQIFRAETIDKIAHLWTRSTVTLLDVRFQTIDPSRPLQQYKMPSSMLVYCYGGTAQVRINETSFGMERFGIVHGGKGTTLSILPGEARLGSFLVYYKAEAPSFFKKDLERLLESVNPFVQQFGYVPTNPVQWLDLLQQMIDSWNGGRAIGRLHAKTLLHQLIHMMCRDLEYGEVQFLEPDPAISTKRYLDEHYREPVMFQEIAEMFGISAGQLTRLFKKRENMSLQQYLTEKRLESAEHLLKHTKATVKEIAYGCGFVDENLLLRIFKKRYKMSPGQYRKKLTMPMPDLCVDNDSQRLYNEKGLASLVKIQRDGEFTMFGQSRSKEMILAAVMSLMLLLSACASGTQGNNGATGSPSPTPGQTQQTSQQGAGETQVPEPVSQTRTISTVMGDVEVPDNPKRVIVDYIIGDVVALGVVPLGVAKAEEGGPQPAFLDGIAESVIIESWDLEPEEIMALDPDLIILSFSKSPYENLSKIAPTVFVPYGETTTEERIRFIGEALNKQEEAEAVLNAYADKLTEAQSILQNAGLSDATITIGQFSDKNSYIAGAKHAVGVLVYNELKLKAPSKVQTEIIDANEYWGDISMEVLGGYMGDYVITLGDIDVAPDNAVWNSVPAIQNNRTIAVGTELSWYTDVMSSTALLDLIVSQLLAAQP